jgi:hypothetical protein
VHGAGEDWFNSPVPRGRQTSHGHVSTVSLDFLKTAAANTGGFAITDTNDFEARDAAVVRRKRVVLHRRFHPAAGAQAGSLPSASK